jgi:4a-hydroxytetrahydrobiopterin dehydratase
LVVLVEDVFDFVENVWIKVVVVVVVIGEWVLVDDAHLLAREFHFKDFKEAMAFTNKVADIAEAEGHHPDLSISWGSVGVELTTHAIGGLSENDFILAAKIDELA